MNEMTITRRNRQGGTQQSRALFSTGPLRDGGTLPYLVQAQVEGINLTEWTRSNRALVQSLYDDHRAVLFRGFAVKQVSDLETFVRETSVGDPLVYRDRSTPRTSQGDGIYTSTVHPSDQRIAPHNEGTYWLKWAKKIYFCCLKAASAGGETPLIDVSKVYRRIDPEIREEFEVKGMMLVRNYNDGFGLRWQEVFQTDSKDEVASYCRENKIEFEWKEGDRLRTRQIRPAVRQHPRTGEPLWFNHAAFFHYSALAPEIRDGLVADFGIEGLPYNTCFGDGSPISAEKIAHVSQAYEQERVLFPWQSGDTLLLDNMAIAHAREPYKGERLVVVSMTEPTTGQSAQSAKSEK